MLHQLEDLTISLSRFPHTYSSVIWFVDRDT